MYTYVCPVQVVNHSVSNIEFEWTGMESMEAAHISVQPNAGSVGTYVPSTLSTYCTARTYVRMYVCLYVYMYIHTYVCMYVRMYVRTFHKLFVAHILLLLSHPNSTELCSAFTVEWSLSRV